MPDRTYFEIFSLPQHLNLDTAALEKAAAFTGRPAGY